MWPNPTRRPGRVRVLPLLLLGLLAPSGGAAAQEMAAPVAIQVPLLLKVLAFDRALPERAPGELVVGVLYQGRYRTSARVADEVHEALGTGSMVGAARVRSVPIDLDREEDLGAALVRAGVHVLYVAPLRAVAVRDVTASAAGHRVTTMTGVPRYVEEGVAIGIDLHAERPRILVNLGASRAAGASFSSQLLKVARLSDAGADER